MEETVRKVSAIFDKMASVEITPTSNYSVPEYWMNRAIKGDEKCKNNLFNWISLSLNIDKSILNAVFNVKYNKTNENKIMNKKLIRLTESDLHRIVKESVKRILREDAGNEYRGVLLPYGYDIKIWGPKIDVCLDKKGWSTDEIQRAIDWYAHQEMVDYQHKW